MPAHRAPESRPLRVVVLSCGVLGERVADALAALDAVDRVLLLTAPFEQKARGPVEKLIRSLKYDGVLSTVGGLAARALRWVRSPAPGRERRVDAEAPSERSTRPSGVTHRRVEAFEAASSLDLLDAFGPDLGVVAGAYVLPERVFRLPRLGSINLHAGEVPDYRGSAPAFWELHHGEDTVGVTVHEVTAELDAGRVVLQETLPLNPAPSGDPLAYVERVRREILEPAGVRLLCRAVSAIADGTVEPRSQDETRARTFPKPTRSDVWRLRWRVAVRRLRKLGAALAGRLVFGSGLYRRVLGDRAVVVLFHRVSAGAEGNPLACSPETFARYCRFFDRFFQVLGLGDLLDRLRRGEDLGGRLVITFDDGYLDNYSQARPILERADQPACFFLATGFLGSSRSPRWDEVRGERPEWMTWDHVSDLLDRGFEIGGHTRNHVDLGTTDGDRAYREILASRRDIHRRTGVDTPFFSYPFGGEANITEANRERVRQAGFACCLSAFGGTVERGTDPFRIPRIPVSDWYGSPYHFGWRILRE